MAPPVDDPNGKKFRKTFTFGSRSGKNEAESSAKHQVKKSISKRDISYPHLQPTLAHDAIGILNTDAFERPVVHPQDSKGKGKQPAGGHNGSSSKMYLNPNANIESSVTEAMDELAPLPMAGQGRHTMNSRYSYGTSNEHAEVSISRAHSTSKTSESAKIGSRGINIPRSATTAFSPVTAHAEPSIKTSGASAYYEPEEINRKVSAMLAATAALEGRRPLNEAATPTPSKVSVMKNKVIAKMTSIWSRIHDKKPQKGAEDEKVKPMAPALHQARHISSPVKDTGVLTVASGNTGGYKAQTVTPSYRISRKPVAGGSRISLPAGSPSQGSHHSTADPFVDQGVGTSAAGSDPEPSTGRQHGAFRSGNEPVNPFGTEEGFYFHMNDILATSPVAASTPRGSRQQKVTAHTGFGQEEQQVAYGPGPGSYGIASASTDDEDGDLSDSSSKTVIVRKDYLKEFAGPASRINNPSNECESEEDVESESDIVAKTKKHPSPSKEELEQLERQFQQLVPTLYLSQLTDDELASITVEIARAVPVVARHVPQRPAEASTSGGASGSGQAGTQSGPAVRTVTVLPPAAWIHQRPLIRVSPRSGEPSGSQPTTDNNNNGHH